ncbi:MAG TPA: endonuclease V [Nitrososphaeraceae archaeon]
MTYLQNRFGKKVIAKDTFDVSQIKYICGVDVSYKRGIAYCSAVIINKDTFETIELANSKTPVWHPYIPGLFALREFRPVLTTLKLLKQPFEILLINGHGMLHPRKCGLACSVGLMIDKPTIGVAKGLLCGFVRADQFIEYNNQVLGFRFKKGMTKQIYISVGNRITLMTSVKIVKNLIKEGEWMPEPLRLADTNSKNQSNFKYPFTS